MTDLERAVLGALRAAIHDHGPITLQTISSAAKRIIGNLRNVSVTPQERSAEVSPPLRKGRRRKRPPPA